MIEVMKLFPVNNSQVPQPSLWDNSNSINHSLTGTSIHNHTHWHKITLLSHTHNPSTPSPNHPPFLAFHSMMFCEGCLSSVDVHAFLNYWSMCSYSPPRPFISAIAWRNNWMFSHNDFVNQFQFFVFLKTPNFLFKKKNVTVDKNSVNNITVIGHFYLM